VATWQFDLHLIPRERVAENAGPEPSFLGRDVFDSVQWWEFHQPPEDFQVGLTELLTPLPSWSPSVALWGTDEGDRIDVSSRDGRVISVFVRLDARRLQPRILRGVVRIATEWQCVLYTESNRVVEPQIDALVREVVGSPAFRFAEDPERFLQQLAADRGVDTSL
jgi:hypothetical protein